MESAGPLALIHRGRTFQSPERYRTAAAQDDLALPRAGTVTVAGLVVRVARPGLVEEYSVSMDGVRQDVVVLERLVTGGGRGAGRTDCRRRPIGVGEIRPQDCLFAAKSARCQWQETSGPDRSSGIQLRTLHSALTMAMLVDDAEAVYPVRMDLTFSDATLDPHEPEHSGRRR